MAMRFRKLQEHAKEAVGVYRLVTGFHTGSHSQCVCVCVRERERESVCKCMCESVSEQPTAVEIIMK